MSALSESDRPASGSVPPKGTVIYRGERSSGSPTAGIHWTTSQDVAKPLAGSKENPGELLSVELTDPERQVIPYGALRSSYFDEKSGHPRQNQYSRMQGFPSEQEIRLRPGAKFRINGRDIEITNTRGHIVYPNLHEYAVTPEAADREWSHAANELGHEQLSMLVSVHEGDGPAKGYIPALDYREGNFSDQFSSYIKDLLKFGHHPDNPEVPTHFSKSMDQYTPPKKYQR